VTPVDFTLLYPPFRARLKMMLLLLSASGHRFVVTEGFRTYTRQNELFNQGRVDNQPRVTDARPGQSPHNFGLAVDVCLDADASRPGLQPNWENEAYEPLREACASFSLLWGGTWSKPDRPHIQWPGYAAAAELEPLRDIFEAKGLLAVWEFLERKEQ